MDTAIYVIAHDGTGRTHSLLSQLGLKQKVQFVSCINPLKADTFPKLALASVVGLPGGRCEVLPHCANPANMPPARHLPFSTWWDEPIFQESFWEGEHKVARLGRTLSRKNLVFHLRSQDNGSHFDGSIEQEHYVNFAISRRIGMYKLNADGESVLFLNPHLSSMRQIAWEVEESLKHIRGGPELPPPEPFPPKPYRLEDPHRWAPETLSIVPPRDKGKAP
jgi:hypothetical protein